jgi:hypothetical protein
MYKVVHEAERNEILYIPIILIHIYDFGSKENGTSMES